MTRRSIEGNFFVWRIALRKVAVFMTVGAGFADTVLTIEYTPSYHSRVARRVAGTQFRVATRDPILRPRIPVSAIITANAIFTLLHWLSCNKYTGAIHDRSRGCTQVVFRPMMFAGAQFRVATTRKAVPGDHKEVLATSLWAQFF